MLKLLIGHWSVCSGILTESNDESECQRLIKKFVENLRIVVLYTNQQAATFRARFPINQKAHAGYVTTSRIRLTRSPFLRK